MSNIVDIVKGEFDAYYVEGELPKEWGESFMLVGLPILAKDSADRLRRRAGVNNLTLPDLVAFLENVRANPNHEFMLILRNPDSPLWDNDENWPVFRELLRLIIDNLSR